MGIISPQTTGFRTPRPSFSTALYVGDRSPRFRASNNHACLTLALRERPDAQVLFWQQPVAPDQVRFVDHGQPFRVSIVPDAYFALEDHLRRMHQFVEADNSTLTNARFLRKLKGYWRYWEQSKQTVRYIKNYRVLTITKTERCKENLRTVAVKASPQGQVSFWFTTEERCAIQDSATTLSAIWQTAEDEGWHSLLD